MRSRVSREVRISGVRVFLMRYTLRMNSSILEMIRMMVTEKKFDVTPEIIEIKIYKETCFYF